MAFDEASQVRPFGAIDPGRLLVDAGDEKQLQPTDPFARYGGDGNPTWEDNEGEISLQGVERLLDAFEPVGLPLGRHYRSRHRPLMVISDYHLNDD